MLARVRKEEGFGLIELVMAMLMLSIGILAILAAFTSGSNAIRRASRVATASALADAQMERYRALRYSSIALDSASVSSANGIPSYTSDPAWRSSQVMASCTTPLPLECTASQSLAGADGVTYRVDTYIICVNTYSTSCTPPDDRLKLVTIVVRDSASPSQTWVRISSNFDLATG